MLYTLLPDGEMAMMMMIMMSRSLQCREPPFSAPRSSLDWSRGSAEALHASFPFTPDSGVRAALVQPVIGRNTLASPVYYTYGLFDLMMETLSKVRGGL